MSDVDTSPDALEGRIHMLDVAQHHLQADGALDRDLLCQAVAGTASVIRTLQEELRQERASYEAESARAMLSAAQKGE